ncbi:MAG: dihydrodipicolinate reductase C-terminal domain-containing protein [Gemmatimonadaceae bacterium]
MSALRLAIIGPGKMGSAVAELAASMGHDVVATIADGMSIDVDSLKDAQVAIEFTDPAAAAANVTACVLSGCPVVVGTTGWYDQLPAIAKLVDGRGGALLWSANFSLGVHALSAIVRRAGEQFLQLPGFDAQLIETHHTMKKDAPSGTARMLQKDFAVTSGTEVPITSIRLGSVPGTHTLVLDGAFEQIVITHEARDRRVFAEGALLAAKWLVGRHGVFTLDDVLSPKSDKEAQ